MITATTATYRIPVAAIVERIFTVPQIIGKRTSGPTSPQPIRIQKKIPCPTITR